MPYLPNLMEPCGRFVARHLGRLCQTLQHRGERLRQGVAAAASEAAADAVQEAALALLDQRGNDRHAPW